MEIALRRRSSLASCGHVIRRGEGYLKVHYKSGEWGNCKTLCTKCAERYVTEVRKELMKALSS